jgi:hypothetical protein
VFAASSSAALHQAAQLHPGEVGGALLVARDLLLQPADLLVLLLQPRHDPVPVPQHLEAELDLVPHLVQHVVEGPVRGLEQLHDVLLRPEDGAEGHGDHRELPHHRLVHQLVGEYVLPRRVVDPDGRVAHHGSEVLEVDGVDHVRIAADPDGTELPVLIALDDAVDVLAFVGGRRFGRPVSDAARSSAMAVH